MGRHKLDSEKRKDISIHMRMNKQEIELLDELAEKLEMTRSDTIRLALLYLGDRKFNSRHKQLS